MPCPYLSGRTLEAGHPGAIGGAHLHGIAFHPVCGRGLQGGHIPLFLLHDAFRLGALFEGGDRRTDGDVALVISFVGGRVVIGPGIAGQVSVRTEDRRGLGGTYSSAEPPRS